MKTAAIGALVLLFSAIPSSSDEQKSFRELPWKFPRVRTAAKEKNEVLEKWFLFYNHPAIRDRVQFSLTYDPWSKNEQPEFVK